VLHNHLHSQVNLTICFSIEIPIVIAIGQQYFTIKMH